jgi:hypothetical protein
MDALADPRLTRSGIFFGPVEGARISCARRMLDPRPAIGISLRDEGTPGE